jgi:hypothetical protein
MTEQSRLTVIQTGAFQHAWGEVVPIETKYEELIDTEELPDPRILQVAYNLVLILNVRNARAVCVRNLGGQNVTVQPTPEEAIRLGKQIVYVGLVEDAEQQPSGWQELRPGKPGSHFGGATTVWLAKDTRVVLRAADPLNPVPVHVLAIPGPTDR